MGPPGNLYSITNVSPTTEARLFFAQARKIRAGEADDAVLEGSQETDHLDAPLSQSVNKRVSPLAAVEEEDGSEEEDEPVRRSGGRGRRRKS